MGTYEFIVALARDAGAPFAFAVSAIGLGLAVPILAIGLSRSANKRAQLLADRDVEIKKIETSVRNGAVVLTKPVSPDEY